MALVEFLNCFDVVSSATASFQISLKECRYFPQRLRHCPRKVCLISFLLFFTKDTLFDPADVPLLPLEAFEHMQVMFTVSANEPCPLKGEHVTLHLRRVKKTRTGAAYLISQ